MRVGLSLLTETRLVANRLACQCSRPLSTGLLRYGMFSSIVYLCLTAGLDENNNQYLIGSSQR